MPDRETHRSQRVGNLFDQYSQPENRLTHALAVCLDEDRRLLRDFLRWVGATPPVRAERLDVIEQSLPGQPAAAEEEAQRRGLPDVVVHDGEGWSLFIESKVAAALGDDQILRHRRTLRLRRFAGAHQVALTLDGVRVPRGVTGRTWSGLYTWLGRHGGGREWPERLRAYLRTAERRLSRDEYLSEGTLTVFDGFPFSAREPYTYGEGKRLLKLALTELRKDKRLLGMGVDPSHPGRGAITGRDTTVVWDFLALRDRPKGAGFIRYPHLTLAIHAQQLEVQFSIPNGVVTPVRRRLAALGEAGLRDLNRRILKRARPLVRAGATVEANAVQRHYLSQRSTPKNDARVSYRLEASLPGGGERVKHQPQWAGLFAALLASKRSNIHFGYVVYMPWGMRGLDSRKSLRLIADAWCALEPVLTVVRKGKPEE